MKLKSFCKTNDTTYWTKQPTEWEKIFTNSTSNRGLIYIIHTHARAHKLDTYLLEWLRSITQVPAHAGKDGEQWEHW